MNDIRLKIPSHVVARQVDDEMVMLNLESGVYFGLNLVGSRFYELIEQSRNFDEIVETMVDEFDVSKERLRSDLLQLIQELKGSGLLESE